MGVVGLDSLNTLLGTDKGSHKTALFRRDNKFMHLSDIAVVPPFEATYSSLPPIHAYCTRTCYALSVCYEFAT